MKLLTDAFTKRLLFFALLQLVIIFGLIWLIAGNDRLFRSTVPIEQRLVSRDESIRKKAQQELLGLDTDGKKQVVSHLIPVLERDDPFTRKWAAISLALVGPAAQEAIPVLLQSMSAKEKDVEQAARVALSEIGAPDAQQLPSLLRTLQDPRESVRCEAALSIGKMGPAAQEAVPLLIGYISHENETPVCFEDALALAAVSVPSVLPPVTELLGSGHPEIRRKAAYVLSQVAIKIPEDASPILRALADEKEPEIRKLLTKALAMPDSAEQGDAALWAAALQSSHSEAVKIAALDLLQQMNPLPANVETIWANGLHDDNPLVREEIARWIRQSAPRGQKTLFLILKMLRDTEPSIRRLGLETLRRTGLHTTLLMQKVAKAQRDPDSGVRCRASEALIESGSTDRVSVPLLIVDLKKDDEDTARCAEDVLGLAGLFDIEVVHSMMHLVQDEKDPDIRSRAAKVLMHLGPRAREAVPALLRAEKEQVPGAEIALKAIRSSNPKRRN